MRGLRQQRSRRDQTCDRRKAWPQTLEKCLGFGDERQGFRAFARKRQFDLGAERARRRITGRKDYRRLASRAGQGAIKTCAEIRILDDRAAGAVLHAMDRRIRPRDDRRVGDDIGDDEFDERAERLDDRANAVGFFEAGRGGVDENEG